MSRLLSQMEAVSHRFEELSIRLNQPETAADPALFRRLMQEYHELEPVVDAYRKLATAKDHLEQAKALLEGETLDADFKEMVQQEVSEKSQDVAELENNLKILLLPKDVNDDKSVIMELPYVLECGVSAAPDEVRGQVVKASIVLVKGTEGTEELKKEIQNYVKQHTAPYKYPRIVEFKEELPKTISGKIIRSKL